MFADAFVIQHKTSGKFDLAKLNKERIAAINFFTHETPFYGSLNATLRSANRADAKPFFCWYCVLLCISVGLCVQAFRLRYDQFDAVNAVRARMKLALAGLYCLKLQRTTVYRGVKLDLADQYPSGKTIMNWSFSSTTSSLSVLQSDQVSWASLAPGTAYFYVPAAGLT